MPKTPYLSMMENWKNRSWIRIRISPKILPNICYTPLKDFLNIPPQLSEQSYLMSKNAVLKCHVEKLDK